MISFQEAKQAVLAKLRVFVFSATSFSLLAAPAAAIAQGPFTGSTSGTLGVTPQGYDNMKAVIERLGFPVEEIQEPDLATLSNIQKFDSLFVNCAASTDGNVDAIAQAVHDYVAGGGILYASDFAEVLVRKAFPGKVNFYSVGADGSGSPWVGNTGVVTAEVVDPGLSAVLGKKTVEVNYNLGGWAVIDSAGAGTKVHMVEPANVIGGTNIDYNSPEYEQYLQDLQNLDYSNPNAYDDLHKKYPGIAGGATGQDVGKKPYVVSFHEGEGEVLYTSFHNEAQNTTDMEKVLDWFGIRTRGGKVARETRGLAEEGGSSTLQEVIDGINKDETKTYKFNATGEADFEIIFNFGGSSLEITVTDPNGKEVTKQNVTEPPFRQKVKAVKGEYTIAVKGTDVPENNYPFVVTVSGDPKAAADPVYQTDTGTKDQESKALGDVLKKTFGKILIFGVAGLIILIVVIILIVKATSKKGGSTATKTEAPKKE